MRRFSETVESKRSKRISRLCLLSNALSASVILRAFWLFIALSVWHQLPKIPGCLFFQKIGRLQYCNIKLLLSLLSYMGLTAKQYRFTFQGWISNSWYHGGKASHIWLFSKWIRCWLKSSPSSPSLAGDTADGGARFSALICQYVPTVIWSQATSKLKGSFSVVTDFQETE